MLSFRSMSMAAAVGAAILLLAAACGGGDDSSAETTAPATTAASTTPAETGEAAGATLNGTVGPEFTISLTQDGAPVSSLAAGTYEIVIDDKSEIHNFHLTGPGVDEATDVGETGMTTWTVTLEAGEYTFVCDPHASSMNGSFTVS